MCIKEIVIGVRKSKSNNGVIWEGLSALDVWHNGDEEKNRKTVQKLTKDS